MMRKLQVILLMLILIPGLVLAEVSKERLPDNLPDNPGDKPDKGRELYLKHCSSCHHPERYGIKAPPLIPETLKGYSNEKIVGIIMDGLPSTQMPSYSGIIGKEEAGEIVSYITSPVVDIKWGLKEIAESRSDSSRDNLYGLMREYRIEESLPNRSLSNIDFENITLVVESGKGVAVMDGREFKVLDRFGTGAIHGGPKFSHSLRHVYAATRDGMISKYDLNRLMVTGRVRTGINTRNIAISHDDRYVAAANNLPENITILDRDLNPLKVIAINGRIGGIYLLHNHNKFICSFRDLNELWLIDYSRDFSIERLTLPEPFEDMAISPFDQIIIGASRGGGKIHIYSINERKVLSSIETTGMPHLASAAFWLDDSETPFAAINHLKTPVVTVINLRKLKVAEDIELSGNGYFIRTHQNTPYIWADTGSDTLQLISKKNLQVVKSLIPSEGNRVMHTEFTKDGRYAMVSLWEDDGAVIIYDAYKLDEIKRIPFRKPAGKYNAMNKTFPHR